ncbi:MAG: TetR/AcrR family transcriptional regulator [Halobacteriovoraceae bacterium]|nr:TetR/AcrR family transcriptional regulator [Halobacteriovoraceae bacterium]
MSIVLIQNEPPNSTLFQAQNNANVYLRKGTEKKIEIIKAAIECIHNLGVEGTTFQSIADQLNTRKANINYHFNDKQDIFKEAILFILSQYIEHLSMNAPESSASTKKKIFHYIDMAFDWGKNYKSQVSVMLLFYYYAHIKDDYAQLQKQIRENGVERLNSLLHSKYSSELNLENAKMIQIFLTGAMIEVFTNPNSNSPQIIDRLKQSILSCLNLK